MVIKVGINGFGRIGRCIARAIYENGDDNIKLVAINARSPIENHKHMLQYDSIHRTFKEKVAIDESGKYLLINNDKVRHFRKSNPEDIPWNEEDVDVVMECTGIFKDQASASAHLKGGAKKVIISAPAKDDTKMIVYGVNENILSEDDKIVSIGSCTTNCLAPVAKIINDTIGIEKGFVTTIHAVTNDQNITDATHKDLRRARAAFSSMIPTSTGAAKAIGKVIPDLNGKLDGTAIRVPTQNVSMIDLCFLSKTSTSKDDLNKIIADNLNGSLKEVLDISYEPLVSIDYNHSSFSSVFDTTGTTVLKDNFVRITAWYDNEWGFSQRMLDVAKLLK